MFDFLIIFLSVILCFFAFYFLLVAFHYFYYRFYKKVKPIKLIEKGTYKRICVLKRLFYYFPKAIAYDLAHRDPNEFKISGLHCFCGEQGSGKTVAMVEMLLRLKKQYPLCKVNTNFDFDYEDDTITSWKDVVFNTNGIYGQIMAIDEIQNWFSSMESKDFPPEMLQEITQQRKQRKMIACTSQRFERMAKPLREQVNYLYKPYTFFGCLTFVRVIKPVVDDSGMLSKGSRTVKFYFFVHNTEIRDSYDTYKKIERQANGGYTKTPFTSEQPPSRFDIKVSGKR